MTLNGGTHKVPLHLFSQDATHMTSKCVFCDIPANPKVDSEFFQYKGLALRVDSLDFMECPECSEEFVTAAQIKENDKKIRQAKDEADALSLEDATFQQRVARWMDACFGREITNDPNERNLRFIEEALELVQSLGMSRDAAHFMVDYVFDRPAGDPPQEVGGTMISLAALCLPHQMDMDGEGEKELARIQPLAKKIRDRQQTKPQPDA